MCRHRHKSIHGHNMEVVDIYTYRVFIFPKNASFSQTKKHTTEKRRKALFCLYYHGCEIWAYGDLKQFGKV